MHEPPNETVERPGPGTLARGAWEAPPWAFYAGIALVLIAAVLYTAARAGLLRRRSAKGAAGSPASAASAASPAPPASPGTKSK